MCVGNLNTNLIATYFQVIEQFLNETGYRRTEEWMDETKVKFLWSTSVAIFAVGGMIGSLSAGAIADKFGRSVDDIHINVDTYIQASEKSGMMHTLLMYSFL